jgi:arabinose-5-phosphate isomerase
VAGIFTDGDLRRCLPRIRDAATLPIGEVMTKAPRTIEPARLAIECVDRMETAPKVSQLLVVDAAGLLVGALHLHDLFRARVV